MNTAPKLYIETLREMFAVCANERRMKEADALAAAIAALVPPSGEGVGLTVADAWFESPTEITIHAKASGGAKLPEEGTKIYTTPPPASQEGEGDFPVMRSAFVTSESCGPDGDYRLVFRFRSLEALQQAHREWVTTPQSAPEE